MNISIKKVIKSDTLALILTITPVIMLLLVIDAKYFGVIAKNFSRSKTSNPADAVLFIKITIASLLVCVPLLLLRIQKIKKHFKNGFEVAARVLKISFRKDRGRIVFSYTIEGEEYLGTNTIMRNSMTTSFREGTQIAVIVAPDNYTKSYIKEMFVED